MFRQESFATMLKPTEGPASAERLPPLREDLQLFPGPPTQEGAPTWTFYDAVRHGYYGIGQEALAVLSHWHVGTVPALLQVVNQPCTEPITPERLRGFLLFLQGNNLLRPMGDVGIQYLTTQLRKTKETSLRWFISHYLFLRFPLLHADPFLDKLQPLTRFFYSQTWGRLLWFFALMGLFLVGRQWDRFMATFVDMFSLQGMVWFFLALAVSKIVHELAHAFTAKRYGCRVPTMGVALLLLWPVLYSDTTDTWRLRSWQQRRHVALAGVRAELALAAIFMFIWSFLPEGPVQEAAVLMAMTNWVGSLLFNLNPFMRFDGYFILADTLGVPNLQPRAFALARWWLRQQLLGLGEPPPERFDQALSRTMILYAFGTWIYRLILFTGIAVVVYAFFFKLLGLLLFAFEIVLFIVWPILHEGLQWWQRRDAMRWNVNTVIFVVIILAFLGLQTIPWSSRVSIPAVIRAKEFTWLYPPVAAQLEQLVVVRGERVYQGAPLMRFVKPELTFQKSQAAARITLLKTMISRSATSDRTDNTLKVMQEELATTHSLAQGIEKLQARLTLTAPFSGMLVDLDDNLQPGLWVAPKQLLGRFIDPEQANLVGFVEGHALSRIRAGARGVFVFEDPTRDTLSVQVTQVDPVNTAILDIPYLASVFGGKITVQNSDPAKMVPKSALYRVVLEPVPPCQATAQVLRGVVHLQAQAESLLMHAIRTASSVLIRESGF